LALKLPSSRRWYSAQSKRSSTCSAPCSPAPPTIGRRAIWLRFAGWIILALEFALGADIIRTAIAPTWPDIGELAAISTIRIALGLFLERDMESALAKEGRPAT